jgi:hypothetical protein
VCVCVCVCVTKIPSSSDLLVQDVLLAGQPYARVPLVNFVERGEQYLLTAELPGIQKSDVKIEMDSKRGTLTLKAEKSDTKDVDEDSFRVHESISSSFSRSLTLPDDGNRGRFLLWSVMLCFVLSDYSCIYIFSRHRCNPACRVQRRHHLPLSAAQTRGRAEGARPADRNSISDSPSSSPSFLLTYSNTYLLISIKLKL